MDFVWGLSLYENKEEVYLYVEQTRTVVCRFVVSPSRVHSQDHGAIFVCSGAKSYEHTFAWAQHWQATKSKQSMGSLDHERRVTPSP